MRHSMARAPRSPALPLVIVAVALATACHRGPSTAAEQARRAACESADSSGTLRITNNSGRLLEVHSVTTTGQDRVLGNASPGTSTFEVPGPATLGLRYYATEIAGRQPYALVSWIRPHDRAGAGTVSMDLLCGRSG